MNKLARNRLLKTGALIGGEWINDPQKTFPVFNPSTGEMLADVADCGADESQDAITAAHEAFGPWAKRTASDRADILRRWHDLMISHVDELAEILTAEMGKPLAEAVGEVRYGAAYLEWYAEEAKRVYGEVIPPNRADDRMFVTRHPVGVCGAITPWNFPNAMLMRKAAAALAVGCTMVAKPAEETPLSALAAAALAIEAGVPEGVFSVVTTSRAAEVGEVLTSDERVRKISFTGSTQVGRILMRQSAQTVKKVSMELGGNAPFIVFDDADLDVAIDAAMASKYRNAGQTCVCANRFYVHRDILETFVARLEDRVSALTVDDGFADGAQIGPLINKAAHDKITSLVSDAIAKGATVKVGGVDHPKGDLFYKPTILADVTPDMEIAREEIFGPVTAITAFDDEAEVIAWANDTIFGLAAYMFTTDLNRAFRVSEALEYGMVGVNQGLISAVNAPFGGVKQSGIGREGSRHGVDDYLEMKYTVMGGIR